MPTQRQSWRSCSLHPRSSSRSLGEFCISLAAILYAWQQVVWIFFRWPRRISQISWPSKWLNGLFSVFDTRWVMRCLWNSLRFGRRIWHVGSGQTTWQLMGSNPIMTISLRKLVLSASLCWRRCPCSNVRSKSSNFSRLPIIGHFVFRPPHSSALNRARCGPPSQSLWLWMWRTRMAPEMGVRSERHSGTGQANSVFWSWEFFTWDLSLSGRTIFFSLRYLQLRAKQLKVSSRVWPFMWRSKSYDRLNVAFERQLGKLHLRPDCSGSKCWSILAP